MRSVGTLRADLSNFSKYHLRRRVYDYPAPETQLGIVDLGFDPNEFAARLRGLAGRYEVTTLDEPAYRDRRYPILCAAAKRTEARRTVLLLGGVHGNEHAGILAVPEILERVDEPAVRLVAVAPVNPVGAAELSRYNADGFDVNRDFVRFATPEARAVRAVVEREKADFVVSLHEGPQDGCFMFLNRSVDEGLAARLARAIEQGGSPLAAKDYFGRTLNPAGVARMSRSVWFLEWLWAQTLQMKSTGRWCDDRGIPEITLESSWRSPDREARVRAHVDLVSALVAELAGA